MKRKLLILMLVTTIVGLIPVSVYASNETNGKENSKEVITKHCMEKEINADGIEKEIGLVTYEKQSDNETMTKAGCSSGQHTNVIEMGGIDTTRIHGKVHPGYCTVKTTSYWRCTACNTTGHDDRYMLVWCPSSDIYGDENE